MRYRFCLKWKKALSLIFDMRSTETTTGVCLWPTTDDTGRVELYSERLKKIGAATLKNLQKLQKSPAGR